ncbi:MAG: hypothetical protein NC212_09620 [Staphylococcus sp.]|nr:hypothetical protein [Staphylococcus sp.]
MKIQTLNTKQKKNRRPVSEKFYQSLNERAIASAKVAGNPTLGVDVMLAIDRYINEGYEPSSNMMELRLIFALLKPEIDKAMARSAAARKRRARRAEVAACEQDKTAFESCPSDVPTAHPEADEDAGPIPVCNRRERRLQMREQQRLAKRRIVPLAGKRT